MTGDTIKDNVWLYYLFIISQWISQTASSHRQSSWKINVINLIAFTTFSFCHFLLLDDIVVGCFVPFPVVCCERLPSSMPHFLWMPRTAAAADDTFGAVALSAATVGSPSVIVVGFHRPIILTVIDVNLKQLLFPSASSLPAMSVLSCWLELINIIITWRRAFPDTESPD